MKDAVKMNGEAEIPPPPPPKKVAVVPLVPLPVQARSPKIEAKKMRSKIEAVDIEGGEGEDSKDVVYKDLPSYLASSAYRKRVIEWGGISMAGCDRVPGFDLVPFLP
jgi:hypothetical protein